jgi:allophanate hydrolase subunit 1
MALCSTGTVRTYLSERKASSMTASEGLTFLSARPGNLLMRLRTTSQPDEYVSAFRDMIESLCLLGITRIRDLKDGLHIVYDVRVVDDKDLKDMLTAADAAVRFTRGDHRSRTHSLSVTFDSPGSIDLPVASLLLGTTETGLIRRLCRTGHVVASLTATTAAPIVGISASDAMSSGTQACRSRKTVLPGTLLLSDAGITIAAHGCFSNELQIGRINSPDVTPPRRLYVGDLVRFRQSPAT